MPLGPDLLGYTATILSAVSFLPQVVKVVKTGETDDLSLGTFACTTLALTMWCVYGVWTGAVPVALANGLTAALASIILVIKLRNDRSRRGGRGERRFDRMSAAARARARRAPNSLRRRPDLRRRTNDPRLAGLQRLSIVLGNGDKRHESRSSCRDVGRGQGQGEAHLGRADR